MACGSPIADMELEIGACVSRLSHSTAGIWRRKSGRATWPIRSRYDLLPLVGKMLGLDTTKERSSGATGRSSELNVAVLQSFERSGVTIVDHHTAAKQFKRFEKNEADAGRAVTGQWSWLIPPLSPATTHVFHQHYEDRIVTPNLFARSGCPFSGFPSSLKRGI